MGGWRGARGRAGRTRSSQMGRTCSAPSPERQASATKRVRSSSTLILVTRSQRAPTSTRSLASGAAAPLAAPQRSAAAKLRGACPPPPELRGACTPPPEAPAATGAATRGAAEGAAAEGAAAEGAAAAAEEEKPKGPTVTAEVDFNDCTKKGVKALLTKPATHEELSQLTGATVTLRGKFLLPGDASGERGLHLRIEGQREEVD